MVFNFFGGPLILKLTPKIPSPVLLPTSIFPIKGNDPITLLSVVAGTKVPLKLIKLFSSIYKPLNIDEFKNKKIIAFSGIGNPSNFFHLLKANDNNATLLTTEKDYLRINSSFKKNIKYLIIKLEMENKNNFIEQIKKIL